MNTVLISPRKRFYLKLFGSGTALQLKKIKGREKKGKGKKEKKEISEVSNSILFKMTLQRVPQKKKL